MNVLFDMETGDPDDLITLLMLLVNPDVQLRGITCYQGSPIQIGLINHVLKLSKMDESIPVGGWNSVEPAELSDYYTDVVGNWKSMNATLTPVDVFKQVFENYPDTHVLTGAPLTNLGIVLEKLPNVEFSKMTTQGGYLGNLVIPEQKLKKFKGRDEFRTYNLGNDVEAFEKLNSSTKINSLTYVTKDLCHGFTYGIEIHKDVKFGNTPVHQLLKKCLAKYADAGKNKAMHDPLAMLIMLYPELGHTIPIQMGYRIDERGHPVFSSFEGSGNRFGLVSYNQEKTWKKFVQLCESAELNKTLEGSKHKL